MSNPNKAEWSKNYADDSGIEFAVRFDLDKIGNDGSSGIVEFETVSCISFPLTQLDWLIDCLQQLKALTND